MQTHAIPTRFTSQLVNQICPISVPVADRLLRTSLEQLARCVLPLDTGALDTGPLDTGPLGTGMSMDPTFRLDMKLLGQVTCGPGDRGPAPVVFVRQVAMYLGHVTLGFSLTDVGRIFGRDRTTAAYACRTVEDARDDRTLDRTLELLEAAARMTVQRIGPGFDFERV